MQLVAIIEPTIVYDVDLPMKLCRIDFGPILPIIIFDDVDLH